MPVMKCSVHGILYSVHWKEALRQREERRYYEMHKDYMKRCMWKWFTQGLVHTRYSVDFVCSLSFSFFSSNRKRKFFCKMFACLLVEIGPIRLFHILNIY